MMLIGCVAVVWSGSVNDRVGEFLMCLGCFNETCSCGKHAACVGGLFTLVRIRSSLVAKIVSMQTATGRTSVNRRCLQRQWS